MQHRQEYLSATEAVDEHNGSNKQEQDAMIGPLLQYEREFGEKFGKLPPAFVNMHADREPELFLRAPQAMALIKYFKEKSPILDSSKADNIDRIMAIIRHEYGHTQKKLLIGPYHQLGMNLEERKAELVSGDKGGYLDVKYMISDLSLATGADIKAMLTSSLREQDTLSSFVSQSARLIGLRNTMLLMALKPLPYENDPEHAKKFADVSKLRADGDESTMDIPIRETVSRTGIEKLEKGVYKWMQRVDDNTGLSDFHELSVPDYRKLHGLGISADVIAEQVRKIREERRDKISV